MEFIDPLDPNMDQYATTAVWDAFKDLYRCRRRLDFDVRKDDIITAWVETLDPDRQAQAMIRMDLCGSDSD